MVCLVDCSQVGQSVSAFSCVLVGWEQCLDEAIGEGILHGGGTSAGEWCQSQPG